MNPSHIAIRNPSSILIITGMILLLGFFSYQVLPRESAPDIQIPMLIVTVPFPGASPEDVESLITHKAELEFQNIEHLKEIKSTSTEGASSITLEFSKDFDVDKARNKVREALDTLKPEMPEDAEDPIITEINLSEQPLLLVNLSGDVGLVRLKDVADDLKDQIETIPGILEVRRAGGLEREIRVFVDPQKLRYYQIDLNQVATTIERENANMPGGTLTMGPTKYLIRVPGEFEDPSEINDLVIATPNSSPVFVRDVARVIFGFKELTSRSRLDGLESVSLSVVKRSGENLLKIRKRVQGMVAEKAEQNEGKIKFNILADQGERVEKIVNDLENNIFTGFLLVLIVLLVVMGLRNAMFVAAAIPLSILLSMMVLEWLGFTLNIVVLFSLILALGMLVDNAIVVVENIYRHVQAGKDKKEAALIGISEVAIPITTSTITTLAAFTPIIFMPGIIGEFMGFLPKTLIITLTSSLVIGLLINPVFCSTMMKRPRKATGNLDEASGVKNTPTIVRYRKILEWALGNRKKVLGGSVALFVVMTMLYVVTTLRPKGVEFFPNTEPEEAVINITLPMGSTLEVSDELVKEIEGDLHSFSESLEAVVANVGQRRGSGGGNAGGTTTFRSHVVIDFPNWELWEKLPSEILGEVRTSLEKVTGAEVKMSKMQRGPPTGPPINIEIRGEDFGVMQEISTKIKGRIRHLKGIVDLIDNFDKSRPEIKVVIDREKTARMGLRTLDVGRAVRTAFNGRKVSEYREGKEEYDIYVQLDQNFRMNPTDLETLFLRTSAGESVPLSELARVVTGPAFGSIRHIGLDRVITVSAGAEGVPGPVLLRKVQKKLEGLELPKGYTISYTGENKDREESQAFLLRSFLIALVAIYLVLVTQFNSFAIPFIIMTSVVLSLMGVFLGLIIHRSPFGIIMTGIGVISLAGIVVNNAIVLIDFIGQLRATGMERTQAIITAGLVRLRPVFLTAITTVLGLLPMAIGMDINFYRWPPIIFGSEGGAFWKSMALAVMYGLSVATVLTLVFVPVLYSQLEDWKEDIIGWWGKKEEA